MLYAIKWQCERDKSFGKWFRKKKPCLDLKKYLAIEVEEIWDADLWAKVWIRDMQDTKRKVCSLEWNFRAPVCKFWETFQRQTTMNPQPKPQPNCSASDHHLITRRTGGALLPLSTLVTSCYCCSQKSVCCALLAPLILKSFRILRWFIKKKKTTQEIFVCVDLDILSILL